jgi:hypothetical protein
VQHSRIKKLNCYHFSNKLQPAQPHKLISGPILGRITLAELYASSPTAINTFNKTKKPMMPKKKYLRDVLNIMMKNHDLL